MKQIYLESYFKRGYRHLMKYISNIAHFNKRTQETIYHRIQVIEFFDEFGLDASKKAFKVGRSTIFSWKQKLNKSGGKLSSLAPKPKAPKSRTKRVWSKEVVEFVKEYRLVHPGSDKTTIEPLLDAFCHSINIKEVSESTIGRIISDLKERSLIPNYQVRTSINGKTGNLRIRGTKKKEHKLRIKGYRPKNPGDLVQIDAIELFIDGIRRYIITAIDVKTRFAFAYSYKTLSSNSARDFMIRLIEVAPFEIIHIQTDNGKEFHKHFREYVKQQEIIHFYNYPRSPKMNSYVERFNRTIQDQYVSWHMHDLHNLDEFNQGLMQYLVWYNTEKVHRSIGKIPPLQYFVDNFIDIKKSNMLWTVTNT